MIDTSNFPRTKVSHWDEEGNRWMKTVKYSNPEPGNNDIEIEWIQVPAQITPRASAGPWSMSYVGKYESWYWDSCGHLAFDKIECPCGKKHRDKPQERQMELFSEDNDLWNE